MPAPLLEPEPARAAANRPPASRPAATGEAGAQSAPTVEVHIGAIDIVAEAPRPADAYPPPAPVRGLSLDDYLDGTGRE